MELQHFFHMHPLNLNHYGASVGILTYRKYHCEGCHEGILGFSYSCKTCRFFLHKSCGEQPRKLQHPLHLQHPLILLRASPNDELCYFCNKYILGGFAYHCSHCNFNLHLKCASISFTVEAEFHNHPLKLLRKSISFTCDACGSEDKDMYSYLCVTCPLMVHLKCAALPLIVKHTSHHHTFNLTDSSQVNQSDRRICRLCVKKVDTNRVYYCSKCNFVAHLDCATREGETEEMKQPLKSTCMLKNEDSELGESIDLLTYVVKKMKIGEDKLK